MSSFNRTSRGNDDVDRVALVKKLSRLTPGDFASLEASIEGASDQLSQRGTVAEQVKELIRWAKSTNGPGLYEIERVYRELWPSPDDLPSGPGLTPQSTVGGSQPDPVDGSESAAEFRAQRERYRGRIRNALSQQLAQLFEDTKVYPREIARELEIEDIPEDLARIRDAIVDQLLSDDGSIPLLNALIRGFPVDRAGGPGAVAILENCMDLILPYHFSPDLVASAAGCQNPKGGGLIGGYVMTKCGAELVAASLDQHHALFDPSDPDLRASTPDLRGKYAVEAERAAFGKYPGSSKDDVIGDDAIRFLESVLSVLGKESLGSLARMLKWDKKERKRATYCFARLEERGADRDYAMKVLEKASELLPELPIFLLAPDSKARDHEAEYLRVLRRRFDRSGR